MSRSRTLKEDQELTQIREAEQQLLLLEREYAQIPKKLAQELKERECTMPPLAEIEDRRRQRVHEDTVSRGEASNILRDQTRSLMLTAMLLAATGALIWWGVKLMQG
jgi:hypothetical protein